MTEAKYKKLCAKMEKCVVNPDTEKAHKEADSIIREALWEDGYYTLVELYNRVDKWYA